MKKHYGIWILGLLLVAVIIIGYNTSRTPETLKIGVVYPGSGTLAKHGEWMRRGITLAQQELAERGIKNIEIIYENTECDNAKFQTALEKLVAVDKIDAYIGPFCGGEITLAAQASTKHKLIGMTPSTNFGNQSDYFFSTQATIQTESAYLANALYDRGLRKIAIYSFNNDFGIAHRDSFTKTFEARGGKITAVALVNSFTQTDYRTDILKLRATAPEAIFIAYSNPAIVKQIHETDRSIQIISTYGMESPELLKLGPAAEGLIYSYRIPELAKQNEAQKMFSEKYRREHDELPVLTAVDSYDALQLLVQTFNACTNASNQAECAQQTLSSTKNYPGIGGVISIDPITHEVNKPILLKTVRGGQFVEL